MQIGGAAFVQIEWRLGGALSLCRLHWCHQVSRSPNGHCNPEWPLAAIFRMGSVNTYLCPDGLGAHLHRVGKQIMLVRDRKIGSCGSRERWGHPWVLYYSPVYYLGPKQFSRMPLGLPLPCQSATPPVDAALISRCRLWCLWCWRYTVVTTCTTVPVTTCTAALVTIDVIVFVTTRVPGTVAPSVLPELLQPYYCTSANDCRLPPTLLSIFTCNS